MSRSVADDDRRAEPDQFIKIPHGSVGQSDAAARPVLHIGLCRHLAVSMNVDLAAESGVLRRHGAPADRRQNVRVFLISVLFGMELMMSIHAVPRAPQ